MSSLLFQTLIASALLATACGDGTPAPSAPTADASGVHDATADTDDGYFTADPRHVHLNWSDDPASTIAALWATAASAGAGSVRYGTTPDALNSSAEATVQSVGTELFGRVTVHEAHIIGLLADTTYHYRVGTEGHLSPVYHFKTAPAQRGSGDVNFIVSGDSRDDVNVWRMIQQRAQSVTPTADFELFTGDAVLLGAIQSTWNAWFDASRESLANLPWIMVHGNHEALSANYLAQFAQPAAPGDELFFSIDYGPIHFLVLNDTLTDGTAGLLSGPQIDFIQRDLRGVDRARTPWVIVAQHKSPYSSSTHGEEADAQALRRVWAPLFDRFHVDMVFSGHDHNFEVSRSMRGNVAVPENQGTVYLVSGGAGAALYPSGRSTFTRYSERVQNFLSVHVTRTTLDMTPYRIDGTVVRDGVVRLQRM